MKLLEVAGEIVGVIVSEENNTLLIRKAKIFHNDTKDDLVLFPEATYYDKKLLANYWLRVKPTTLIPETINSSHSRSAIRKLLGM